jgi:hypothetical protein
MKKSVLSIMMAVSIMTASFAQTDKKNKVGAHFAFGNGDYGAPNTYGGGSYDTNNYYSAGLDYSRALSNTWDFCSGVEYTYSNMTVTPAYMGGESVCLPHKEHLTLTAIPVQMKYHIWKIVYLDGGIFLNILARTSEDWSVKSRNGEYQSTHYVGMLLGCGLGIGLEQELFGSGVMLSLNPYLRWNGIGGIGSFQFAQLKGYRFLQSGVSLGIGYKF